MLAGVRFAHPYSSPSQIQCLQKDGATQKSRYRKHIDNTLYTHPIKDFKDSYVLIADNMSCLEQSVLPCPGFHDSRLGLDL
jgi:hypothetical protein